MPNGNDLATLLLVSQLGCAGRVPAPSAPHPGRAAWPPLDEALLEQQAVTYGFKLGRPAAIKVTPGGEAVLFTRTPPRSPVGDLYEHDVASGRTRRLASAAELLGGGGEVLSDEEKARRERARKDTTGIVGYELSADGRKVLVPLSGRLFEIDRAGGPARELAIGPGAPPIDARYSPDGARVAFVRDGDLHVHAGGATRRLTTRPSEEVEHGVAEFVAQEEMDRHRGYWWSPESTTIAYQRNNCREVQLLRVADPAHPDRAPVPFRYPRAGTANADVTLWLVAAAGGPPVEVTWDRARFPYLAAVDWDRGPLTLVVQDRLQKELAVLVADARGRTTEIARERDEAWLNLDPTLPRWIDAEHMLWSSERSGRWQLELRRAGGGPPRLLTPPELGYESTEGVDEDGRAVWVLAAPDPRGNDLYRVPLDGGPPEKVTTTRGVHEVAAARRGGLHVVRASLEDGSVVHEIRRRDGSLAGTLESVAESPPYAARVEWTRVDVAGTTLEAALVRPRDLEPGRRYPVIVSTYGGPTHPVVTLDRRALLSDQVFADAGFIVVRVDNRGTPGRGRDFQRVVAGDLATIAVNDQADALLALGARYPELDLGRVGIMGWSFGGYVSALAVMLRPDVFHAAIAGAPVTDWRLYDTHYTERYMGLPDENRAGYDRASALVQAPRLARPLLLIHGTTDDNVYFAHSLELADRLFRAGKPFELLPLSGFTHMVPDPAVKKALAARQVDFMRRSLAAASR
jgi:dipeptidyl-peptidase-4